MEYDWSICQSSNIRYLVSARGLCSLNVLGSCMRHCSCLSYVCMDKGVMENDERGG